MPDKRMGDLLTDDSFVKWIRGQASPKEAMHWEEWVSDDEKRQEMVQHAKQLMYLTGSYEQTIPDPQVELKKFETMAFEKGESNKNTPGAKIYEMSRPAKYVGAVVAASLLLVISVGFYLFYENSPIGDPVEQVANTKHEFTTDYGERISLKLSDGTSIILNANSELKYTSSVKAGQNIDIWLKGEAYFDITHFEGASRRFVTVHTPDGLIEVLGTTFVVKTTGKGTRAVLEEGKIKVKLETETGDPGSEFLMDPGEMARFVKDSGQVNLEKVNTSVYTSWINGKWDFDQTPLKEIVPRIEDTYGVEVILANEELGDRQISGSIKSTDLETMKRALSRAINEPIKKRDSKTIVIGMD